MENEDNDLEQTKVKKPRSEAQIEAFKKAQQIRKDNALIKKEKIAQIKEQYKGKQPDQGPSQDFRPDPEPKPDSVKTVKTKTEVQPKKAVAKKVIKKIVEEESEEEEEVIVVKKKKKPVKKIVYESESEDDNQRPVKSAPQQPQQRYYPSNQRHGAYGVFAII